MYTTSTNHWPTSQGQFTLQNREYNKWYDNSEPPTFLDAVLYKNFDISYPNLFKQILYKKYQNFCVEVVVPKTKNRALHRL